MADQEIEPGLDNVEKTVNTQRIRRLAYAELFDAWRIMPRAMIILYMLLVAFLVDKFFRIPTIQKVQCDADLIVKLIQAHIPVDQAQLLACHVVDIVGGPTTSHTFLVTTICGLSAAIFGLYTSSGRDWVRGAAPWIFRQKEKKKEDAPDEGK